MTYPTWAEILGLVFGRIENTKKKFWNYLTLSDLKFIANSRPSASTFKRFSKTIFSHSRSGQFLEKNILSSYGSAVHLSKCFKKVYSTTYCNQKIRRMVQEYDHRIDRKCSYSSSYISCPSCPCIFWRYTSSCIFSVAIYLHIPEKNIKRLK